MALLVVGSAFCDFNWTKVPLAYNVALGRLRCGMIAVTCLYLPTSASLDLVTQLSGCGTFYKEPKRQGRHNIRCV